MAQRVVGYEPFESSGLERPGAVPRRSVARLGDTRMVALDRIAELVPHYVAMIATVFLVLWIVRATAGDLGFWVELLFVLVVAIAYPALVRRLGVAPSSWE